MVNNYAIRLALTPLLLEEKRSGWSVMLQLLLFLFSVIRRVAVSKVPKSLPMRRYRPCDPALLFTLIKEKKFMRTVQEGPLTTWRRESTAAKSERATVLPRQNRKSPMLVFQDKIIENPESRISIELRLTKQGNVAYKIMIDGFRDGKTFRTTDGGVYTPEVDYEEHPFIDPRKPKLHRFTYVGHHLCPD